MMMASRDVFTDKVIVMGQDGNVYQKDASWEGPANWYMMGDDVLYTFDDIKQPFKVIWTPGDNV